MEPPVLSILPFVLFFLPVWCIMVQGRSARTLSAVGLSTLCQELLGKPLGECCAVVCCACLVSDCQPHDSLKNYEKCRSLSSCKHASLSQWFFLSSSFILFSSVILFSLSSTTYRGCVKEWCDTVALQPARRLCLAPYMVLVVCTCDLQTSRSRCQTGSPGL